MLFLIIIGVPTYFMLPMYLILRWLESRDYTLFGVEFDIHIIGWSIVVIEVGILFQILESNGVINLIK